MNNAYAWTSQTTTTTTPPPSRRDRLADMAMVALIREIKPTTWKVDEVDMYVGRAAAIAYMVADAMIAESKK
jgi:hypothetical protein